MLRLSNGDWAVSDFGLAVEAERHTDPLTSTLRQGLGTWVYTAPEQWQRREAPITFQQVLDRLNDLFGSEDFTQSQKVLFLEALLRTLPRRW